MIVWLFCYRRWAWDDLTGQLWAGMSIMCSIGRMHVCRSSSRRPTSQSSSAFCKKSSSGTERVSWLMPSCSTTGTWSLAAQRQRALSLGGWLTLTHTQRWHAHRHSVDSEHLYQGKFKSSVFQSDVHLSTVCRFVERNPLRASMGASGGGLAMDEPASVRVRYAGGALAGCRLACTAAASLADIREWCRD